MSSAGGLLAQTGAVLLFFFSFFFFVSWWERGYGVTPICPAGLWGEGLFVEAAFMGAQRMLVAVVSCMPYCHGP